jgi:glyoxylase-like metal-dependent hydrolase (beta-lactamase superfamily II)
VHQLTDRIHVETGLRGANHGWIETSEGIVLVDTPFKPSDAVRLRAHLDGLGRLRYVVNTEPHADHWTGNTYFDAPAVAHAGVRRRVLEMDVAGHHGRIAALGPGEPTHVATYRAKAPEVTFESELTLHVGDRTLRLIHMPGHTPFQAAVLVVEDGVVFTSDNLFSGVQTWLQEADPDAWLSALDSLRSLDAKVLVPGHGSICGKDRLDEQAAYIREWVAYVRDGVDRGLLRDEAVERLTALTDRYPMDAEQEGLAPMVMRRNVANLYDFVTGQGIHAPT